MLAPWNFKWYHWIEDNEEVRLGTQYVMGDLQIGSFRFFCYMKDWFGSECVSVWHVPRRILGHVPNATKIHKVCLKFDAKEIGLKLLIAFVGHVCVQFYCTTVSFLIFSLHFLNSRAVSHTDSLLH